MVFEKFISAYLFQIAREKSCDYLLIIYMIKFEMVRQKKTYAYHAIREKLRHKGRGLDLKTKDFIGADQTLLFISQTESRILIFNLHCIIHFALLSQPIRIEYFFSCILMYFSSILAQSHVCKVRPSHLKK